MKAIDPITPSAYLEALKARAIANIEPFRNRVASSDFNELKIRVRHSATALEVEGYYKTWQQKLAFKQIAQLPDLHQKPRKAAA